MTLVWQSYLSGLLVDLGLIMAIGSQNVFVLAQSLRREHYWSVALLCICCDVALIAGGVYGLANLMLTHPPLLNAVRWGGSAFLLWYGANALRRAINPQGLQSGKVPPRSLRTVLLSTLAVTLLNPHVYLDTVLLIGSLGARQGTPGAFVIGAATGSIIWFASLALGGSRLAPWLARPATWRVLDLLVAVMMFTVAAQLLAGS